MLPPIDWSNCAAWEVAEQAYITGYNHVFTGGALSLAEELNKRMYEMGQKDALGDRALAEEESL